MVAIRIVLGAILVTTSMSHVSLAAHRRNGPGGVELFVIDGSFSDERGQYDRHSWLRLPPGHGHHPRSPEGCELYVRRGNPFG